MFKVGDVVVLTVDNPYGVKDTNVKGDVGVIREIIENDYTLYYEIVSRHNGFTYCDCFTYVESEFRLATDEECKKELKEILSIYC